MEKLPNGLVVALAVVVAAASIYAYQVGKGAGSVGVQNTATVVNAEPGQNPIGGHLECLDAAAKNCTVGFVTNDGKKYGLDTSKAEFVDGELTAGRKMWVLGTIGAGAYDGTIAVRAIVENNK